MARVGILGGTFNPPHLGHLVCAQEALVQLALERVLLVPVARPPHKVVEPEPGAEVRVELCRLVADADDRFEVSRADVDREPPSYTVDTLRALTEQSPGDELTFIVGGDMAHSLPGWREPEEVLRLAELGVAEREGVGRRDIAERLAVLAEGAQRIRFFDMPRLDISSSLVRRRVAAGRPIRYLVPDAVAEHVERAGLYRPGRATGAAA